MLNKSSVAPSRQNDINNLATGAGIALTGKVLGRGTHIIGQIILARFLGPSFFGLYAIGWTILMVVSMIGPLGLDKGVIRFVSRNLSFRQKLVNGIIVQSLLISFVSGLALGFFFYFFAPYIAEAYQKPDLEVVLRWMAVSFPFVTLLRVATSTARASKKIFFYILSDAISQPFVNLFLIIIFLISGLQLENALFAGVGSYVFSSILALYLVWKIYSNITSSNNWIFYPTKKLMQFSLPASVAGLSLLLISWIDRLIVGYFRSEAEVGIYQAASQSSIIFAIILSSFDAIFAPMIAELYHKKQIQRLEQLFSTSTRWGILLSLPIFLLIFFFPDEILFVLFGKEYVAGWLPLSILAVGQFANVGTGAIGFLFVMTGNQNRWLLLSGSMLFLNGAISIWLVPNYGMVGAAIGTAIALSALFTFGIIQIKKMLRIFPYNRKYIKVLLAAVSVTGVMYILAMVPFDNTTIHLVLSASLAFVTMVFTLLLLGLEDEDNMVIALLLSRIRNKNS